jgi:hypothetical protein
MITSHNAEHEATHEVAKKSITIEVISKDVPEHLRIGGGDAISIS